MPQIKLNCLIIIQFTQGYHIAPWTENFQMFKLVLEKAEAPEIKLPISAGSSEKQESSRTTSLSALLTTPKPSTVWITINCGKFFKRVKGFCTSVQFSRSVVSDSLRPHEPQHARPPCPSPTPGVCPNSCPLSQWCHPAISSSVVSFSCCPQSLPASGSSPRGQLFAWGGQSTGVSASASVLPMNTQDCLK